MDMNLWKRELVANTQLLMERTYSVALALAVAAVQSGLATDHGGGTPFIREHSATEFLRSIV